MSSTNFFKKAFDFLFIILAMHWHFCSKFVNFILMKVYYFSSLLYTVFTGSVFKEMYNESVAETDMFRYGDKVQYVSMYPPKDGLPVKKLKIF